MKVNNSDYGTIIKFGNLELFVEKLKFEGTVLKRV